MEEIKRNMQKRKAIVIYIDIDQPMRDADGDRLTKMYLAAEVDRIIDKRVEQGDLNENTKKILTNIVEKIKDPINLEMVNRRNVDIQTGCFKATKSSCLKRLRENVGKMM